MQTGASKSGQPRTFGVAGLRPILEVLKEMNSERNLRRLITMILDTMIRFSNAHRGSIGVLKGDRFNAELSRDRDGCEIPHSDLAALGTMLKAVCENGELVVVEDVRKDARVRARLAGAGTHPRSILCLPLRAKSHLLGAVYLDNTQMSHAFGPRQREFAQILTDHAAIAIENALLHRHTTKDRTTSLANHAHFEVMLECELERARRLGQPCGLLMIDVDNFKSINDTYGHAAGTEVLRRIAQVLSETVRGMDVVGMGGGPEPMLGRYGGDEFEIALPGTSLQGAMKAARRIVTAVQSQPLAIDGRPIRLTVSIGVAAYPDDAADGQELHLRADEALYESKRAGKSRATPCATRKVQRDRQPRVGLLPTWMEDL